MSWKPPKSDLQPFYSKCGSNISSSSWELVRNVDSSANPRPPEPESTCNKVLRWYVSWIRRRSCTVTSRDSWKEVSPTPEAPCWKPQLTDSSRHSMWHDPQNTWDVHSINRVDTPATLSGALQNSQRFCNLPSISEAAGLRQSLNPELLLSPCTLQPPWAEVLPCPWIWSDQHTLGLAAGLP